MDKVRIKNDILAGITVAVVALPLALAFGVVSGAGASAGLWGAIILGFFAALLGGVPVQVSGPTGPMTVVFAAVVLAFPNDFSSVMMVVLCAGLIQIFFGIIDLGKWVKYIPYPIISGFMCGIGVIIIILQINPFLGAQSSSSIIYILTNLFDTLKNINYEALIIGLMTIAIVFFTPKKISKLIPAPLIALFIVTTISIIFNFDVLTIGEIPQSFPSFNLPFSFDVYRLSEILTFAITLAVLGSIDTQLTSVLVDSRMRIKHNSKKELIGQGVGNSLCSLFGAIPGSSATMRTVVNMNNGGTTNISGMVHAVTLLLIVLMLAPLASKIPLALLAGILFKVGIDILDYRFLKVITRISKQDLLIMFTVFFLTVFVDLIMAVGVGITISSVLAVYQMSKSTQMKTKTYKISVEDDDKHFDINIVKVKGSLFFGTAYNLDNTLDKLKNHSKVILDCKNIHILDISAIFKLEEIIQTFKDKKVELILVLKYRHKKRVLNIDKSDIFKNIKIYRSIDDAIDYIKKIN
ncbi:SulP family inorganic anion transporter [Aliarcobacter vitoriensis]|uniref:Sulfate permease n=1 Tax=Aliarcobacter vitoriensis TaxID=2011099 RepID=A0A366MWD4_9BACT|nr:SulP family inorganic anion transporter [Aliarcobacter vitoriensis]RBQ29930.1 sulfate permease [Aliarcobacter vitoriensis]RBQ31894.1 sulfate permease [Arcobacter sp. FW59]